MYGEHTLSADISFEKEDWEISGKDYEEEFRTAVEMVREDHDHEAVIDADNLYKIRVRWNPKTEEVRFDVYALSETFIVTEGDNQ